MVSPDWDVLNRSEGSVKLVLSVEFSLTVTFCGSGTWSKTRSEKKNASDWVDLRHLEVIWTNVLLCCWQLECVSFRTAWSGSISMTYFNYCWFCPASAVKKIWAKTPRCQHRWRCKSERSNIERLTTTLNTSPKAGQNCKRETVFDWLI